MLFFKVPFKRFIKIQIIRFDGMNNVILAEFFFLAKEFNF